VRSNTWPGALEPDDIRAAPESTQRTRADRKFRRHCCHRWPASSSSNRTPHSLRETRDYTKRCLQSQSL